MVIRIGIDFGGTKIEAIGLDRGECVVRRRVGTPATYDEAIGAVVTLVRAIERDAKVACTVGIGAPGSIDPRTGLMRNANTRYLNGRTFREDLVQALGQPVKLANDANCLALSEATDGAAAGMRSAFALILGTGCGGGLVVNGQIVAGGTGIAGEWGHVPLPWPDASEWPGPECWCGRRGCLESWVSGTGLGRDHAERTGQRTDGPDIVAAALAGSTEAAATLAAFVDRLARGMAMLAAIVDPDCFVLGGGLSNVAMLYERLPGLVARYTFGGGWSGPILPARWGDASGVRGAARLWPEPEPTRAIRSAGGAT